MVEINLDDVFTGLPGLNTTVTETTKTHERTPESYSSKTEYDYSSISAHTDHSTSYESSEHVAYSPVQKRLSQAHPPVSNRQSVISVSSVTPISQNDVAPAPADPLLNEIFGAVDLAPVEFPNRILDENEALQHLEDAYAAEEPLGHISLEEKTPSVVSRTNQTGTYNIAPQLVADQLVEQTFGSLQNGEYTNSTVSHHSHHTHNGQNEEMYSSEPQYYASSVHEVQQAEMNIGYEPEEPEEYDSFEPAHLPYTNRTEDGFRKRSQTMDSLASATESRYGGYDVHDEHDVMHNQELDLNHDEVAYERVKHKKHKESPIPLRPLVNSQTDATHRLQRLNQEINEARTKQQLLEEMIAKEKKIVNELRQKQAAPQSSASITSSQGNSSRPTSRNSNQYRPSNYSERSFQSPIVPVAHEHREPVVQQSNIRKLRSNDSECHSVLSHTSSNNTSVSESCCSGSTISHDCDNQSSRKYSNASSVSTLVSDKPGVISQTLSGDSIIEEHVGISEIAERTLHHGTQVAEKNGIALIVPEHKDITGVSKDPKVRKVIFGGFQKPSIEDKTVLLFGPIGSGKTSAINSMLNYLYDVKKENNFRFVTSVRTSPTHVLTAYVINNSILPFSVIIVDTPGVPDQQKNKTVSTLIKHWFESELLSAGAFRLDAISIVLSHDEDSLGWPFIHELATVKRMFGDDLKTNVLPIITNSEVLPQPIAIKSLAQANIAFVEYYKVNNSGFFANRGDLSKLQHNLFFKHGIASMEHFFRDLQELIHPLLAVLRNRTASSPVSPAAVFDPATLY